MWHITNVSHIFCADRNHDPNSDGNPATYINTHTDLYGDSDSNHYADTDSDTDTHHDASHT